MSANAKEFIPILYKLLNLLRADSWHRFIVKTPFYDKKAIIHAINFVVFGPLTTENPKTVTGTTKSDAIKPYYFHKQGGILSFFANNCIPVIIALCKTELKARTADLECPEIEFVIRVNARQNLLDLAFKKIALSRLDDEKKNLDFSRLESIPELLEITPNPLSIPQLLQQLLCHALTLAPNLVSISLSHNALDSVGDLFLAYKKVYEKLQGLQHIAVYAQKLRVLDLSHNNFQDTHVLNPLTGIPITELYLHGNPLCSEFMGPTYIRICASLFPSLYKLDGILLYLWTHLPFSRPNFLVPSSYGDPFDLASQFLHHFFTLYDEADRACLQGIYHRDAYFSQTVTHLELQTTSERSIVRNSVLPSRNLLGQPQQKSFLYHGEETILDMLGKLPKSQHDFYSFTVDVTYHSAVSTIVTVTGLFRTLDFHQYEVPPAQYFMRTFVLLSLPNDRYQITNDILAISNATSVQDEAAFRFTPLKDGEKERILSPQQTIDRGKSWMTASLSDLTGMTMPYAYKCLEDAKWDYKEALTIFTEMYKKDKIPPEAFEKDEKETN